MKEGTKREEMARERYRATRLSEPRLPFTEVCRFWRPLKAVKRKNKATERVRRLFWKRGEGLS